MLAMFQMNSGFGFFYDQVEKKDQIHRLKMSISKILRTISSTHANTHFILHLVIDAKSF